MSDEEKIEEQKKVGAQSALPKITHAGYASLEVRPVPFYDISHSHISFSSQLIRYFTCGPDEVRAWTIRKGTKAPQAAGVIQCVLYLMYHLHQAHLLLSLFHSAPTLKINLFAVKSCHSLT